MKKIRLILISSLLCIATINTSCLTTKTNVGQYRETKGTPYKYSKTKQVWLFWGLLPIGRSNTNTPGDGNCQIVTKFTLGDVLINTITAGIINTYTIKVKTKGKIDNGSKN